MDKKLATGVVVGLSIAGLIAVAVADNSAAAPFNAVTTRRADLAFVTSFCIDRAQLVDGGTSSTMRSYISVPSMTSLSDGGTATDAASMHSEPCVVSDASKRALDSIADGPALVCARASNRLER